jgi:hypothetical protein
MTHTRELNMHSLLDFKILPSFRKRPALLSCMKVSTKNAA